MFIPEDKLKTLDEYREWIQTMRVLIKFVNALKHLSIPGKPVEWVEHDWVSKNHSVWVWLQTAQNGNV